MPVDMQFQDIISAEATLDPTSRLTLPINSTKRKITDVDDVIYMISCTETVSLIKNDFNVDTDIHKHNIKSIHETTKDAGYSTSNESDVMYRNLTDAKCEAKRMFFYSLKKVLTLSESFDEKELQQFGVSDSSYEELEEENITHKEFCILVIMNQLRRGFASFQVNPQHMNWNTSFRIVIGGKIRAHYNATVTVAVTSKRLV